MSYPSSSLMATIRQAPALTDEEQQRLFQWATDPFEMRPFNLEWRWKDVHFFIDLNGRAVSHAGLLKHTVRAGGRDVVVAGLGGVITVPEAQGHGYARMLVQHACEFAFKQWKVDAGLLFCLPRMLPFYADLGWKRITQPVQVEQSSGHLRAPIPAMVYPAEKLPLLSGPIDLRSQPW